MTNIGAVLYQTGKDMGDLYSFRMDGIGSVVVKSPRTGILKIGSIYFNELYEDDSMSASSLKFIHSLYRMATLFHEARHSDGHGDSLGFFHVKCPVAIL